MKYKNSSSKTKLFKKICSGPALVDCSRLSSSNFKDQNHIIYNYHLRKNLMNGILSLFYFKKENANKKDLLLGK